MTDLATLPNIFSLQRSQIDEIIERLRETGWVDLEPKKRAFALAFTETYDKKQAAKDANIANETANKYLRDPLVLALISDLQENLAKLNFITEDFLRQKYLDLLPKLMGEESVSVVYEGDSFETEKFDGPAVISVLKELGKHTEGFYKGNNTSKNGGNVHVHINIDAMTGGTGVTIEHKDD